MSTDLLDLKELVDGQVDPYATVNEALRQIEGRTIRVLSRTTDAQPGSPSAGDTYIITGSATGADWDGFSEHDIAHYYGGSWKAYTPIEGLRLWVNDEDTTIAFNGSAYVDAVPFSRRRVPHLAKSSSWTVTGGDAGVLNVVDASGGDVSATLPSAASAKHLEFGFYLGNAEGNSLILKNAGGTTLFTLGTADQFMWLASDGTSWRVISKGVGAESGASGNVTGPESSTDNSVPRFDGTGGATIQASPVIIDDAGLMSGAGRSRAMKSGDFTLGISDMGRRLECGSGGVMACTVPDNASVALPVGYEVILVQTDVALVEVAAAAGVTVRAPDGSKIDGQWTSACLYKRSTNEWVLDGRSLSGGVDGAVIWSATDKTSNGELTNGGFRIVAQNTPAAARSEAAKSAGKWYAEIHAESNAAGSVYLAGLASSNLDITGAPRLGDPTTGGDAESIGVYYNGVVKTLDVQVADIGSLGQGDTLRIAVDMDSGRAYVGGNGGWDGDPAAGTGGIDISAWPDAMLACRLDNDTAWVIREKPGYDIPSGFQQWVV
ncbi:DUF2793 domain-containing protein [Spectribacter hydrogenooxidans]|uniref:DUF2793 domain-containing protein n=1 Tax=Spectribacter hydrogenoxidans TaxID=3075608 RepID=A0ABU3C0Q1_9GAMM|nr:DUF2793 domain-containing protein [Salinisphaera sp. W335]MDT0635108.1 DUF2793 domain-containing protein [Salinisphaera sp. W335]